jgi:hypothetical protein
LASQGFYDSSKDTITWDKTSQNGLKVVNPGDSGSVDFSFSPLSLFSAAQGILANPAVNIEVDISGKQAASGFTTANLANSSSTIIRITSDVGFSAKALYYSGAFTNTGPIPPKVGKATTYNVVWTLSNTANSISNAQITSTLPAWVDFASSISPASEDLTYNASTKQVTWNVDRIPKGAGITGPARTVTFKVSLTPSLSQAGTAPNIINEAVLTGHDDFAKVDIKVNKVGLNTYLGSDGAFPPNGGSVVK